MPSPASPSPPVAAVPPPRTVGRGRRRRGGRGRPIGRLRPRGTPRLLYTLLATLPVGGLVVLVLSGAGVITRQAVDGPPPWTNGSVVLSLLATLAALVASARVMNALAQRIRMGQDATRARRHLAVLAAGGGLAVACAVTAVAALAGMIVVPHRLGAVVPAAGAVLSAMGPLGLVTALAERHVRALEHRFPDFLRDLSESYGAGMPMAQAVRAAARSDYGALDPYLQHAARQVSWGVSVADALREFQRAVGTPLVSRAIALVVRATESGGHVKEVLAAAARDVREAKRLDEERRAGMSLYVVVIYVAFAVFLAVTAALQGLLIPSVVASTSEMAQAGASAIPVGAGMTLEDFAALYFAVGLVQAIGSGLVAGVMSEGRAMAGLKHAAVLVVLTGLVLGALA